MNESKPYMNPPNKHISQVDPMWEVTSKYYIDRMWEEYHKMKEELADTKSKLAQAEDMIDTQRTLIKQIHKDEDKLIQTIEALRNQSKGAEQKNWGGLHTDDNGVTIRSEFIKNGEIE